MSLELVVDNACEAQLPLTEDAIHTLISRVLEHERVQADCSVSLTLTDDESMRELNLEWRDVDAPTDVLSFECERPGDADVVPGVPLELGDIVLASAYLERQAAAMGTSVADEWRLMLVHATLHLLGYDHETLDDAARMQGVEEGILSEMETDGTLSAHVLARHREEDS